MPVSNIVTVSSKAPKARNFIVLEVTFRLSKYPKPNISYKDLEEYFGAEKKEDDFRARSLSEAPKRENHPLFSEPSSSNIRSAVLEIRSPKISGSLENRHGRFFFKNPIISEEHFEKLKSKYPDTPFFAAKNGVERFLWLLFSTKFVVSKVSRKGNVELFQNQPLVLINHGKATAQRNFRFFRRNKKNRKRKNEYRN